MLIFGTAEDIRRIRTEIKQQVNIILEKTMAMHHEISELNRYSVDSGIEDISNFIRSILLLLESHINEVKLLLRALEQYEEILREDRKTHSNRILCAGLQVKRRGRKEINSLHFYSRTHETWKDKEGLLIYNNPEEKRAVLELNQGKVPGYKGTCGICSCVNVLRLAGMEITEEEVVRYAKAKKLCQNGLFNTRANGGTGPKERQKILADYGVDSSIEECSVERMAEYVSQGKGVIISVNAFELWGYGVGGLHAITVTSVVKNRKGGIVGFFVADSGQHGKDGNGYYDKDLLEQCLSGRPMNVTRNIIR